MSQQCQLDNCAKTNRITDIYNGEIFCGNCGTVLEEKLDSFNEPRAHSQEDFMSQTRTGPKLSLAMHDRGMYSVMGNNKDSTGRPLSQAAKKRYHRLRMWDSRSKTKKSSERTLIKALSFLNGLKEKLGIPENTIEITCALYRKAQKNRLTRGRSSNSLMAAALYVSCRQTMTPRSLHDISGVGNISKKSIQKTVRMLIQENNIKVPQYDMSSFITKLSNNLGIREKTKRYALKILDDIIRKKSSDGKNPIGQATAALYLASMLQGECINQNKFAKTSGISTVTIRNRTNTIRKVLDL